MRVAEALVEAAEKFMPKVQRIRIPAPATGILSDAASLDAWIAEIRTTLAAALADGPVQPRF